MTIDPKIAARIAAESSANALVKLVPGQGALLLRWTLDTSDKTPVPSVENPTSDAATYLISVASSAASSLALSAARDAVDGVHEKESRVMFATVYTKVFAEAFDIALAELNQEEARAAHEENSENATR